MTIQRPAWAVYQRRLSQQRLAAMKKRQAARRGSSSSGSSKPRTPTNPYYSGPYGPEAGGGNQQRRRAQQNLSMSLAELYHNLPLSKAQAASEAASRGAYESPGRLQAMADLDWQFQMGLMQAMLDYQNAIAR